MTQPVTFRLEEFEGPLDLLLTLVERHKMDLHDIPILALIDQYVQAVDAAPDTDAEVVSSFIEMAARLVEMKSSLLLPHSDEGERMKRELTGRLMEYQQCRRAAERLRERAQAHATLVRAPADLPQETPYALFHPPQVLADCWRELKGRAVPKQEAVQQKFEPLVAAPEVSVNARVVNILRGVVTGQTKTVRRLFSRRMSRSVNVATFLALLELVRGGRVRLETDGELTLWRGHLRHTRKSPKPEQAPESIKESL